MSKYPVVASLENMSQISASVQAPHQIFEIFSSEATTGYLGKKTLNIWNIFGVFDSILGWDKPHHIINTNI